MHERNRGRVTETGDDMRTDNGTGPATTKGAGNIERALSCERRVDHRLGSVSMYVTSG